MKKKNLGNLMEFINGFKSEMEAIKFFIERRWNGNVTCPYQDCNNNEAKIYHLKDGKNFKCSCCSRVFSYKVGTIFDDSKIPLTKWFTAIYLHTANKKGISSLQLAKHISVTQKTAWYMLHRLRYALNSKNGVFGGTTEVDELYLGGKYENMHKSKKELQPQKTVVIGMVNRESGVAKLEVVESADKESLLPKIGCNIKAGSTVVTDTYNAYKDLKNNFTHKTVKHSAGEYVRNEFDVDGKLAFKVHTNTVEGLFGQVRRTILGTYHFISNKHSSKYLKEISFRYSTRKELDLSRFIDFISNTNGKLTYAELIK
jgi:transposase-like protein